MIQQSTNSVIMMVAKICMVYMNVRKVGHKHFMYTTMDVLFVAYFIEKKVQSNHAFSKHTKINIYYF